jgi:hypothetical protein
LGSKDEDANLNAEVTSRLEELFGEEDGDGDFVPEPSGEKPALDIAEMPPPVAPEPSSRPSESAAAVPLDDLKALVYSIDWEITDANMKAFLKEVKRLAGLYRDDPLSTMFLKLHESLGKYIKARKVRAKPEAIKLLSSMYRKFEKMLSNPDMSETEKKKLLAKEVKKYNRFKQSVLEAEGSAKAAAAAPEKEPEKEALSHGPSEYHSPETIMGAPPTPEPEPEPLSMEPEPELISREPEPEPREPESEPAFSEPVPEEFFQEPEPEVADDPEAAEAAIETEAPGPAYESPTETESTGKGAALSGESKEIAEHIVSELSRVIQEEFKELRRVLREARS